MRIATGSHLIPSWLRRTPSNFRKRRQPVDGKRQPRSIEAICWRGKSLPGGEFDDWLRTERAHLRELAIKAIGHKFEQEQGQAAIASARQLLRIDPANEPMHRALMSLYAANGDHAAARKQYRECREALARELNVQPDAETRELDRAIQTDVAEPSDVSGISSHEAGPSDTPSRNWNASKRSGWIVAAVAVLATVVVASTSWWPWPSAAPAQKPAVAVTPFTSSGGDEASQRLAKGLTDDVITDLARFPEFGLVATNANAEYLVQGSIRQESERVRVTAQLVAAKTGDNLWSDRWDRPDSDFFAVEAEIAEQIANRLGGGAGLIQQTGRFAAHRKAPSSLSAYDFYLMGTEKLEQINVPDLIEAIRLLEHAAALDPRHGSSLGRDLSRPNVLADFNVDSDANKKASFDAAERAVKLDPADAEAHAVYAMSLGERGDLGRAKAELIRRSTSGPISLKF